MTSRTTITAVYPGTFDPITLGHEDLMRRAAGMFERLVVAVAVGHHKKTLFALDERLAMVQAAAAPLGNVEVIAFDGLLRDFVRAHAGRVVVRGLRTGGDFEYEFQMAGMNRKLMPEVETIFLTPGEHHQYTSSTFVREIATLGGEVAEFVSPGVLARLNDKFKEG
ncbi:MULTISPECIES: pantetheine-phosphate adenylyltransferase [Roseateles]|jgi:pantetheine-phosphate adenylyltransferase|uniref:Phosphopantetheine adenylyltransferase n=1 Tax=Pelomonas aquatica TaxID=431058 RepID=A0ABU1ZEQ1_9BURK|nr:MULTISPECIES: pantetheine-phosphate adenylyltransferase [Roseateles]KQY86820.1 phosphopantetheine adenylyltransferase [Pelomonas sp. Root1444]MDR7299112.1 pantetheine-phosphate adenylyltransferase [Pelomonas aquatica]